MIADLFECSEASVKVLPNVVDSFITGCIFGQNCFNNAKPASQRKKSPGESPVVLQETHQSLDVMRQTSAPSVEAHRSTLDVSDLRTATRKKTENGHQIFTSLRWAKTIRIAITKSTPASDFCTQNSIVVCLLVFVLVFCFVKHLIKS
ncbi:hypothetical protein BJ741DRAFT_645709 [Chytriomyces cf. hyalinus JEL632]|nr:hypothetical protein BJ741DRAFT_645709 [Chytriomyces cf. hyalinus JEL632]